jgi:3-deoxy-D-manno-octulosonic-acid transferase
VQFLYRLLIHLAAPAGALVFWWRGLRDPDWGDRLGERFGLGRARPSSPGIWVHAVSVGEVVAASPLVQALRRKHPELPLVLTTVTATGARRARELFGDEVLHAWMPFDTPGAVRRFLDRMRPRVVVIMETELWPNLYAACARRAVPIVLANARISPRSLRRYRRFAGLFARVLSGDVTVAAQSERDAERFRELGADPGRTLVLGNLKADLAFPPGMIEAGRDFRARHAPDRPVWIAASTHAGEEEAALEAHAALRTRFPAALLLLVPRHPQRFEAVAELLAGRRLACVRRSRADVPSADTPVYLVDTVGELPLFYAVADIAFVGGTLARVGGHNLLEPAALGLPLVTGPHNFNAPDVALLLQEAGALEVVGNGEGLARAVTALCADPKLRDERGERARGVVADSRGALDKLLALLESRLDKSR